MTSPGDREEFVVLQKAYDLVVDLIPRINKFPRSFKFTLGDRCQDAAMDALLLLVEARWRRDRSMALDAANSALDRLRYLLRLSCEFKLLPVTTGAEVARRIDEVGRMVGVWRKKGRADP